MDMQTNADVLLNCLLYWETFLWISSLAREDQVLPFVYCCFDQVSAVCMNISTVSCPSVGQQAYKPLNVFTQ